jgi:hypothetical protein
MNGLGKIATTSAVAFAIGLAMASQGHAGIIDDFNFTTGSVIDDVTANNSGVVGLRGIGGTLAAGWSRDAIYANLVGGDRVEQADCSSCQMGHFNNDANSVGNGYESWKLGGLQNFGNTTWALDYGLDVGGFDVIMYFYNSQTNTITGELWWRDIAAVGLPGTPGTLSGTLGAGILADYLFIEEFSVGGLYNPSLAANYGGHLGARDFGVASVAGDFNKDNLRIPEPATLALLGLGLASLGFVRRRPN